jgi:hypothetical protein
MLVFHSGLVVTILEKYQHLRKMPGDDLGRSGTTSRSANGANPYGFRRFPSGWLERVAGIEMEGKTRS